MRKEFEDLKKAGEDIEDLNNAVRPWNWKMFQNKTNKPEKGKQTMAQVEIEFKRLKIPYEVFEPKPGQFSKKGFPVGKTLQEFFTPEYMKICKKQNGYREATVATAFQGWAFDRKIHPATILKDKHYLDFEKYLLLHMVEFLPIIISNSVNWDYGCDGDPKDREDEEDFNNNPEDNGDNHLFL